MALVKYDFAQCTTWYIKSFVNSCYSNALIVTVYRFICFKWVKTKHYMYFYHKSSNIVLIVNMKIAKIDKVKNPTLVACG